MTRLASFEPISVVATLLLPRSPSLSHKILSLSSSLGWCGWADVAELTWRHGVRWSWLWHLEVVLVVLVVLMGNRRYLTVNTNKYKKKRKEKEEKTYFRPAIRGKLWRREKWEKRSEWQTAKSTIDHVMCWGWARITWKKFYFCISVRSDVHGQMHVTGLCTSQGYI